MKPELVVVLTVAVVSYGGFREPKTSASGKCITIFMVAFFRPLYSQLGVAVARFLLLHVSLFTVCSSATSADSRSPLTVSRNLILAVPCCVCHPPPGFMSITFLTTHNNHGRLSSLLAQVIHNTSISFLCLHVFMSSRLLHMKHTKNA